MKLFECFTGSSRGPMPSDASIYSSSVVEVSNVRNLDRDQVLYTIMKHLLPTELIPIGFHVNEFNPDVACFLAKNCSSAIDKLCKGNLLVPNPFDPKLPFRIKIIVQHTTTTIMAPISREINRNLTIAIQKSFDPVSHILDLSEFHKRRDLIEYSPLFLPKILGHVLNMSKQSIPNMQGINLANNEITTLRAMEVFSGCSLTYLNLENNMIKSVPELGPLKHVNIRELHLSGNPFCSDFDSVTYLQLVRQYAPQLEKLDGVSNLRGLLSAKKNFVCNYEGCDLVEQFIQRFFPLYDSANRQMLDALYHKNAIFSLTATYIPGQATSSTAQMKDYKLQSRNIMSLADYSRNNDYLFRGSAAIMRIFARLPPSEHDLCSFSTDLIYFTDKCAVLVVHGVFREPAKTLLDKERLLGFSRNFVFESNNGQYLITNEELHVYNALTAQTARAFKENRPVAFDTLPLPETPKEKQQLIEAVKLITTLSSEWAKKCLEECNYDLKEALKLFVELYKVDKIPPNAFAEEEKSGSKKVEIVREYAANVSSVENENVSVNATQTQHPTAASGGSNFPVAVENQSVSGGKGSPNMIHHLKELSSNFRKDFSPQRNVYEPPTPVPESERYSPVLCVSDNEETFTSPTYSVTQSSLENKKFVMERTMLNTPPVKWNAEMLQYARSLIPHDFNTSSDYGHPVADKDGILIGWLSVPPIKTLDSLLCDTLYRNRDNIDLEKHMLKTCRRYWTFQMVTHALSLRPPDIPPNEYYIHAVIDITGETVGILEIPHFATWPRQEISPTIATAIKIFIESQKKIDNAANMNNKISNPPQLEVTSNEQPSFNQTFRDRFLEYRMIITPPSEWSPQMKEYAENLWPSDCDKSEINYPVMQCGECIGYIPLVNPKKPHLSSVAMSNNGSTVTSEKTQVMQHEEIGGKLEMEMNMLNTPKSEWTIPMIRHAIRLRPLTLEPSQSYDHEVLDKDGNMLGILDIPHYSSWSSSQMDPNERVASVTQVARENTGGKNDIMRVMMVTPREQWTPEMNAYANSLFPRHCKQQYYKVRVYESGKEIGHVFLMNPNNVGEKMNSGSKTIPKGLELEKKMLDLPQKNWTISMIKHAMTLRPLSFAQSETYVHDVIDGTGKILGSLNIPHHSEWPKNQIAPGIKDAFISSILKGVTPEVIPKAKKESTAPKVSTASKVSTIPKVSAAPKVSSAPKVFATPKVSTAPKVSASPKVSTAPKVSAVSKVPTASKVSIATSQVMCSAVNTSETNTCINYDEFSVEEFNLTIRMMKTDASKWSLEMLILARSIMSPNSKDHVGIRHTVKDEQGKPIGTLCLPPLPKINELIKKKRKTVKNTSLNSSAKKPFNGFDVNMEMHMLKIPKFSWSRQMIQHAMTLTTIESGLSILHRIIDKFGTLTGILKIPSKKVLKELQTSKFKGTQLVDNLENSTTLPKEKSPAKVVESEAKAFQNTCKNNEQQKSKQTVISNTKKHIFSEAFILETQMLKQDPSNWNTEMLTYAKSLIPQHNDPKSTYRRLVNNRKGNNIGILTIPSLENINKWLSSKDEQRSKELELEKKMLSQKPKSLWSVGMIKHAISLRPLNLEPSETFIYKVIDLSGRVLGTLRIPHYTVWSKNQIAPAIKNALVSSLMNKTTTDNQCKSAEQTEEQKHSNLSNISNNQQSETEESIKKTTDKNNVVDKSECQLSVKTAGQKQSNVSKISDCPSSAIEKNIEKKTDNDNAVDRSQCMLTKKTGEQKLSKVSNISNIESSGSKETSGNRNDNDIVGDTSHCKLNEKTEEQQSNVSNSCNSQSSVTKECTEQRTDDDIAGDKRSSTYINKELHVNLTKCDKTEAAVSKIITKAKLSVGQINKFNQDPGTSGASSVLNMEDSIRDVDLKLQTTVSSMLQEKEEATNVAMVPELLDCAAQSQTEEPKEVIKQVSESSNTSSKQIRVNLLKCNKQEMADEKNKKEEPEVKALDEIKLDIGFEPSLGTPANSTTSEEEIKSGTHSDKRVDSGKSKSNMLEFESKQNLVKPIDVKQSSKGDGSITDDISDVKITQALNKISPSKTFESRVAVETSNVTGEKNVHKIVTIIIEDDGIEPTGPRFSEEIKKPPIVDTIIIDDDSSEDDNPAKRPRLSPK